MELRHSAQRRGGGIPGCTIAVAVRMKYWLYVRSSMICLSVHMVIVKMTFYTVMMMMIVEQSVHFYGKLPLLG